MEKPVKLSSRDKKTVFIILFSALIIKLILAFTVDVELRSDSLEYHTLANNIVKLGEYSFEGKLTARLSCGYPLFIASVYKIFGEGQIAVRVIQSFFEVATGLFFFLICLNYLNPRQSIIALSVFTFLPSNILYSQTILTEPLYGLLSCVLLYYCLREKIDWEIFFIGIIWGYTVLVRTSFALSVILVPLFLFLYRKRLFEGFSRNRIRKFVFYSILFITGFFCTIFPWMLRNKNAINSFTIATQGGYTFWAGSNPNATGTWYNKIEESDAKFNIQDEVEKDKAFMKEGIDYAFKNPHKFLFLGIKKLGYLFSSERMIVLYFTKAGEADKTSTDVYRSVNPLIIAFINIPYFIVMLAGAWGLLAIKKKKFILYGLVFLWMLTFFVFVALARYHYVLIPFFTIGAVMLFTDSKKVFRELSVSKKVVAAVFNLFLIAVWISEFYLMYK